MHNNTEQALKIILDEKYDKGNPAYSIYPYVSKDQIVVVKKNDTIIYQKDPVKYFYFILSGRTVILNYIEWTSDSIIDYVKPPHILGLVEYLNNVPAYTAFVMADTRCVLFRIEVDDFVKIIKSNAYLCYRTLVLQGKTTDDNMARAEVNNIFHPKDKLGHYFFLQAQRHIPYVCPLARKDLANELHINLRTLYRYIDSMESSGYLVLHGGKICIEENNFNKLSERYHNIIL